MTPKKGYIIPLTLMLISVAVMLITIMYQQGSLFVPFMSVVHKREQARSLALSGIEIARSQLTRSIQKEDKVVDFKDSKKSNLDATVKKETDEAWLLAHIVPSLNRMQIFALKKDIDGIDGSIEMAISAESGKININAIYDFKKHQFIGQGAKQGVDWQKIMKTVFGKMRKEPSGKQNLYESFEQFLKKRHYKLNDATELLTEQAFWGFSASLFFEPHEPVKRLPYLLDIFTVYTTNAKMQPLLFSNSLLMLLGMQKSLSKTTKQRSSIIQNIGKQFAPQMDWNKNWNTVLKPLYDVELQGLPKGIDAVLDGKFDPTMFSVVSYGIVDGIVQKAYAILERIKQSDKKKIRYETKIRKLYWI